MVVVGFDVAVMLVLNFAEFVQVEAGHVEVAAVLYYVRLLIDSVVSVVVVAAVEAREGFEQRHCFVYKYQLD
jgi:hypothetical protein